MSAATKVRACRGCGCTALNACLVEEPDGTRRGCSWVAIDLCDACCSKVVRKIRGPWKQRELHLVKP